jgi:predicted RNA-binding Zn ribbon-like protein
MVKRAAHVLPAWLEPVLAFINTVDVETGVDKLAPGPVALTGWLTTVGLLAATPPAAATRADHRLAIDLRTGLRSLALANNGGAPDEAAMVPMRSALERLPLVAEVPLDGVVLSGLRPYRRTPVRAALSLVVAGYARAVGTGEWPRIRRCPAEDCAWVFWDSSAKGARRWCTMSVCGNRAKVRAFAQRRAGESDN